MDTIHPLDFRMSSAVIGMMSLSLAVPACRSQHIDEANRQVYQMIEDRQMATLGFSTQVSRHTNNG